MVDSHGRTLEGKALRNFLSLHTGKLPSDDVVHKMKVWYTETKGTRKMTANSRFHGAKFQHGANPYHYAFHLEVLAAELTLNANDREEEHNT